MEATQSRAEVGKFDTAGQIDLEREPFRKEKQLGENGLGGKVQTVTC